MEYHRNFASSGPISTEGKEKNELSFTEKKIYSMQLENVSLIQRLRDYFQIIFADKKGKNVEISDSLLL